MLLVFLCVWGRVVDDVIFGGFFGYLHCADQQNSTSLCVDSDCIFFFRSIWFGCVLCCMLYEMLNFFLVLLASRVPGGFLVVNWLVRRCY